jgi:hypothetical protein
MSNLLLEIIKYFKTFRLYRSPQLQSNTYNTIRYLKQLCKIEKWTGFKHTITDWIWGYHNGEYREYYLLRYDAAWYSKSSPAIRKNIQLPSSVSKCKASIEPERSRRQTEPSCCYEELMSSGMWRSPCGLRLAGYFLGWHLDPPKRRLLFAGLPCVIFQKTKLFTLLLL